MEKLTLVSLIIVAALIALAVIVSLSKSRAGLIKRTALLLLGLATTLYLCGCSMLQSKKPFIHKGYVCYTNATVMEVKNVREQLKFKGPAVKPEKKRLCDVVIKTDQNKIMTTAQEGTVECSTETVNQRRLVYVYNDQIVGINHEPDEFLDEQSKVKQ